MRRDARSLFEVGLLKEALIQADDERQAAIAFADFLLREKAISPVDGQPGIFRLFVVMPEAMKL